MMMNGLDDLGKSEAGTLRKSEKPRDWKSDQFSILLEVYAEENGGKLMISVPCLLMTSENEVHLMINKLFQVLTTFISKWQILRVVYDWLSASLHGIDMGTPQLEVL
jgi:hypothetical protein